MRSAIKLAYSMGSVAMILSGAAFSAGAPTPFGDYKGGGTGNITPNAACATCGTPTLGLGFFQREETIAGVKYIHTIIDDGKGFKSEDFVQFNTVGVASPKGIASKSTIWQGGTEQAPEFSSTSELYAGTWAVASAANTSEIKLGLVLDIKEKTVGSNDAFSTKFDARVITLAAPTNPLNANVTTGLTIDQVIGLEKPGDRQHFFTSIKPATAGGTFKFPAPSGQGVAVTYLANDPIQTVWIGQQVTGAGSFGTTSFSQAKPDGTGTATWITDLASTAPNFPAQLLNEFFPGTGNPGAPVF